MKDIFDSIHAWLIKFVVGKRPVVMNCKLQNLSIHAGSEGVIIHGNKIGPQGKEGE